MVKLFYGLRYIKIDRERFVMENLNVGIQYSYTYKVPLEKTGPYLYPELKELQTMPQVFNSGFMVGLFEFVCVKALVPYLNWPTQQTVGTSFDLSHCSATPPGFEITVHVQLVGIQKNKLLFSILAHDGVDVISQGTHERHIIKENTFLKVVNKKCVRKQKDLLKVG